MTKKFFSKYTIWPLVCLGAITFGLFTVPTFIFGVIGTLGLIFWTICNGNLLARSRILQGIPGQHIFGSIVIFLGTIILHSIVYYLYKSTPFSILLTFAFVQTIVFFISWFFPSYTPIVSRAISLPIFILKKSDWIAVLALVLQFALLNTVFSRATTEVLPSPWILFGPLFFVLFGLSLLLSSIYFLIGKKNYLKAFVTVIHFFLTFCITAIVYKLGYGYDPFLHRAAESVILEQGFIAPKTPFYIGQYALVNMLVHFFDIVSLKKIDIFLMPILASFLLPLSTWFGMRHGLKVKESWAYIATLLLPLYPLATMHTTTPNNLANLFLFVTILLSPIVFQYKKMFAVLFFTAVMAATIHPFTGIFAVWFVVGLFLIYYKKVKYFGILSALYVLCAIFLTPVLFGIFLILKGETIPAVSLLVQNFSVFLSLFLRPYYYANVPDASFVLDIIYLYQPFIPLLLFLFAIYGFLKKQKTFFIFLLIFPLLVLANAYFVSTWITLPGLADFEQIQYAERLRHISLFFVLPLSLYGIVLFLQEIYRKSSTLFFLVLLLFVGSLTTSYYLSYPQQNKKVGFPGFNVTQADYDASEFMDSHSNGQKFVVLSNILTAAAAIDREGFRTYYDTSEGQVFYYSIPSGSPLYTAFLQMVYEGQDRSYMNNVLDLAQVDRAYFVMHDYWKDFSIIVENAKKTADGWQEIGSGKVVVLWYDR